MKLVDIATDQYVVIGNPGNGQPSSLWPNTTTPELMSKFRACEQADHLNSNRSNLTYGALPSNTHWHVKPLSDALRYVIGHDAVTAIRSLQQAHPL